METQKPKSVAVIVAHPDDETLWAGGLMLSHPNCNWFIVCLCRKNDKDRAPKFHKVLQELKAEGIMGDLNDGPQQKPLHETKLEDAILKLLPKKHFDLIITHNPTGEYTKHLRHEEISRSVIILWETNQISTKELWTFAYEDGDKKYLPKAIENATLYHKLTKKIWERKYSLITETYGFKKDSWEGQTTPRDEAFWRFTNHHDAMKWLRKGGVLE